MADYMQKVSALTSSALTEYLTNRQEGRLVEFLENDPTDFTDAPEQIWVNTTENVLKYVYDGTVVEVNLSGPGVVNAEDYGVTNNGLDQATFLQDAVTSMPDSSVLVLPNYSIRIGSIVSATGKNLLVIGGPATKVIQTTNNPVFEFSGTWGNIYNPTLFENVSYIIPNDVIPSTSVSSTLVTKITLPSAPTDISRYDVIRVVSEDLIPDAMDNQRRKGEYAKVASVVGNVVYLTHTLRETYTTSPKIAKLYDITFGLKQIEFATEITAPAGFAQPMLRMNYGQNCVFEDLKITSGFGTFLLARSLYGYTAERMVVNGLVNNNALLHLGYGIHDAASEYGKVRGCDFYKVRHGFTTNGVSSSSTTNLGMYGYSAHTTISDSMCHGATASGFDTHPESYDITFVNCKSVGAHIGSIDSAGAGFSARGREVSFVNCHSDHDKYGFLLFSNGNGSNGLRMKQCEVKNSSSYPVQIDGREGIANIEIADCILESSANYLVQILTNAGGAVTDMSIKRTTFKMITTTTGSAGVQVGDSVSIDFEDILVDARNCTAVDNRFVIVDGDNSTVTGRHIRIMESTTKTDGLFSNTRNAFIATGTGNTIEVEDIRSTDFLRVPVTGFTVNRSDYASKQTILTSGSSSNEIFVDVTTTNQNITQLQQALGDVIYLRLKPVGGSFDIGEFPLGYREGQVLVVRNAGGGNFNIRLTASGAAFRSQPATITLYDGQVATYVLAAGTWFLISTNYLATRNSTTASRPTLITVGYPFFDTTLGKPIWVKTAPVVDAGGAITTPAVWVDATGTTV